MNIGEIKAFLGDKPQANPSVSVQQQLREQGLQQAANGVVRQTEGQSFGFSSPTTVGIRVYHNSLNQSLQIEGKKANLPAPEEKKSSLFDFEEIAKNVLNFVGGVLKNAAAGGADAETLSSLFEQARSGVSKGIKLAENDLKGFMNEEITNGISASADLIEKGIQQLQDALLGKSDDTEQQNEGRSATGVTETVSASQQNSGSLVINTKDGDEVTLRFEDFKQFDFNRQQLIQSAQIETEPKPSDKGTNDVMPREVTDAVALPNEKQAASVVSPSTASLDEAPSSNTTPELAANNPSNTISSTNGVFVERNSVSFSVSGDLDEQELQAIGALVADANSLATDFFENDIDGAFNKALELGYNQQELTGFALQLARQEQVQVVKAYETVSHYNEKADRQPDPVKAVEPISEYLDKMLSVFDQSQQKLKDGSEYEKLINGIVNQVQDVGTTDLLSAINRFHMFNKQLLDNLPR